MKKVFYIVALILAVAWFLGFFALGAGRVIHTTLPDLYIQCTWITAKTQSRTGLLMPPVYSVVVQYLFKIETGGRKLLVLLAMAPTFYRVNMK